MPLRLTLICHGATAATRRSTFPANEPLERPPAVGDRRLRGLLRRVDRACTSPALRARQTAMALGLEAEQEPAVRDMDYGRWAGRTLMEVQADEPGDLRATLEDPHAAPHGGESQAELLMRISDWLAGLSAGSGHVAVVTHAAVVRAALLTALDAPLHAFWRVDVPPLSLTDLRHDGRRWAVRGVGIPLTVAED